MNDEEITANVNIFHVAGSDTTATLMTAATFYLLKTPRKALDEIRGAFDEGANINFLNATSWLL